VVVGLGPRAIDLERSAYRASHIALYSSYLLPAPPALAAKQPGQTTPISPDFHVERRSNDSGRCQRVQIRSAIADRVELDRAEASTSPAGWSHSRNPVRTRHSIAGRSTGGLAAGFVRRAGFNTLWVFASFE